MIESRRLRRAGTSAEAGVRRVARVGKRDVSVVSIIRVDVRVGDGTGGLDRCSGVRLLQETGVDNGRGSDVWRWNTGSNGRQVGLDA